jgi:hypothetical protein
MKTVWIYVDTGKQVGDRDHPMLTIRTGRKSSALALH